MTELTFAKSFLSTLDSRPLKLQSDYALNPRELSLSSTYTLPKMPNAMRPPSASATKSTSSTVTVTLKSTRNPVLELTLPDQDATTTTILDLKDKVAKELGLNEAGRGKVKVLWERKPVGDAKSVREVIGADEAEDGKVEFGIMVMGWKAPAAAAGAAREVKEEDKMDVDTEAKVKVELDDTFWDNLRDFLQQMLPDDGRGAEEVLGSFRKGWETR